MPSIQDIPTNRKRGFTLIELLIVVAIVAVISTIVILIFNPAEIRRQSQDATRLSDMSTFAQGVSYGLVVAAQTATTFDYDGPSFPNDSCKGQSNQRIFVSVPSDNGEIPPTPPSGWVWAQVTKGNFYNNNGTGWLPVDFVKSEQSSFPYVAKPLPVDPVNTFDSGFYYTYVCGSGSYEINAALASGKYQQRLLASDGGDDPNLYELGSNLTLTPTPTTLPTVSASSPVRVNDNVVANVDVTTASFTPPANSILVVTVNIDATGAGDYNVVVTSAPAVAFTTNVERNRTESGGGYAGIFTGVKTTSEPMTVSVRRTNGAAFIEKLSVKVYVVTGGNTTTPVGAVGEGNSAVDNFTASAYTSTVNNSLAFGTATDFSAQGLPSSTDIEDAAHFPGAISVLSVYKSSVTTPVGTAVTLNFDAGASAPSWKWVAAEISPQ